MIPAQFRQLFLAALMQMAKRLGIATDRLFGEIPPTVVTENNIFRLYSMTKAITSVAVLQLVAKGIIGLDDPLNEIMPEMVVIPILDGDGNLLQSDK